MKPPFWLGLCLATLLAGCRPALEAPRPRALSLRALIDSLTATPPLERAHWGIQLYDAGARRVLLNHNAQRHFIPASNTKLVVTAAALAQLGPDYRYRTALLAQGARDSAADRLVIVGRGDPTLSSRFHPGDLAVLDSLADSVALRGLREVGELVVDASYFADEPVHSTWEVGDLPYSYAPAVAAFAVDEGTVRVAVAPGAAPGEAAMFQVLAPAGALAVESAVRTDTGRAQTVSATRWPRPERIRLEGTIGVAAAPDTLALAVPEPAAFAAQALIVALERRGVHVPGGARVTDDAEQARALHAGGSTVVATWQSPELAGIVRAILKPSQNWIAEQVLKTLGAERGTAGTWAEGVRVERRFLFEEVGIDSMAVQLRDGSGLSAQNLLTPEAIVRLLDYAARAPWGAAYRAALPQPSEEGSTLSSRLEGLEGRVAAKTGTITNVATLSGYIGTPRGERIFSIMVNASGRSSREVRDGIDRLVRALATGAER